MKRIGQDVAGRPTLGTSRRDVAGLSSVPSWPSVASVRNAFPPTLDDPADTVAEEAILLADFADFMSTEVDDEILAKLGPDPDFRERLRSRLWRTFVQTHLSDPDQRH